MFSGIIEKTAVISAHEKHEAQSRLYIQTGFPDLAAGESVAVNGICLTVVEASPAGAALFYLSPETWSCTNLGRSQVGDRVNLERALGVNARLSGHIVQGHVDGLAEVVAITPHGEARALHFRMPQALGRFCVTKGSIAINGVSLTLNSVNDEGSHTLISVMIIPHTWEVTNFHQSAIGESVNIEVDILAKYLERLCQPYLKQ